MADVQRQAARAISSTITVLVHLGQYTRPVSVRFDTGRCFSAMMEAIRRSFQDVLAQQEFFMQIKREEWGGAFVDVSDNTYKIHMLKIVIMTIHSCQIPTVKSPVAP